LLFQTWIQSSTITASRWSNLSISDNASKGQH